MANEAERSRSEQTNVKDAPASLLDQVITETRIGRNEEQREESRRQISAFVEEAMRGTLRISKDIEATIAARIADIDQLLTRQLNEIMHAEDFQKLEGSWRGLNYLVMQSETSTTLKIKVINATKEELRRGPGRAGGVGPSAPLQKNYQEEEGEVRGAPRRAP